MEPQREQMEFDILFIGGGPANLAGAVHLMNLARTKGIEIEVGLIEKGAQIGAHSISGAILDPVALKELIPDYLEKGCPIEEKESVEELYFLTGNRYIRVPFIPKYMHNKGCHIISISKFTAWLGKTAEDLGVNIFPGFTGTKVLYDSGFSRVLGVSTGDNGIGKNGEKKSSFEPGIDLLAKVTIFGEGPSGSLLQDLGQKMGIFSGKMPQVFETAIKEVIELDQSSPFISSGTNVIHTFGYPLGQNTKGGGFFYKMKDNFAALGLVIGLDYETPLFEPYEAFLQFKKNPLIAKNIEGGKVVQQGAKTLSSGGFYTMPQLAVDGAVFTGDSASMLNIQRLKGIHTAMKSGMLAAEAIMNALEKDDFSHKTLEVYESKVKKSWIYDELYAARNFTQALSKKGIIKFIHLGAQYLTNGKGLHDPLAIRPDFSTLKKISANRSNVKADSRIKKSKVKELDGKLYVDKLTGVFLSGTRHEEDQPCHIIVHNTNICITECFETYRNPCTRFCPGNVYEIEDEKSCKPKRLRLNPSNCLHCKTCEIKDPYNNIAWTCPEGGGGPNYSIV